MNLGIKTLVLSIYLHQEVRNFLRQAFAVNLPIFVNFQENAEKE